jgi:hypothetical protein
VEVDRLRRGRGRRGGPDRDGAAAPRVIASVQTFRGRRLPPALEPQC